MCRVAKIVGDILQYKLRQISTTFSLLQKYPVMKKLFYFLFLWQIFVTFATPPSYGYGDYRLRRSPQRAIMVSGYYPSSYDSQYRPKSATTAFVSGETIATNSYFGGRYRPQQETEEFDLPVENHKKGTQQLPPPPEIDSTEENTNIKPNNIPKRKPPKPQEDDEEDDDGGWFGSARKNPSYNAYFPIMFGGHGGKGRNDEGGYPSPGGATAIANSYSTGRGGIATSRATAYGDPYASTLFRNFKKKQPTQDLYS